MIEKEERDEYLRKEQKEHQQREALLKEFDRIKAGQEQHMKQQQQHQQRPN
ncbi:MAG: hypothetical protein P1U36_01590 [Legionellaceae bacterium]|nr:hypothetical protein [Legionellaceae bacterium]